MDRHHCPKRGGVEWRGLQQGPHYGKPYWHNRNGMRFLLFLKTSNKLGVIVLSINFQVKSDIILNIIYVQQEHI